jgi:2-haloacid dehalogenase
VIDLVVLDVNETLFPLDPIGARMADVGLEGRLERWFSRVLRDGISAAAAHRFAGFRDLAEHHLHELLSDVDAEVRARSVAHVLAGFGEVEPHPDVGPGLLRLQAAGVPAVTLTNGSAQVVRDFLARSGLAGLVADVHDVTEVGRWKPAPEAYRHVVAQHGATLTSTAMIAVHPWDLLGAGAAGLITAWLDRDGRSYPEVFGEPDVRAQTLDGLVDALLSDDT